MKPLHRFLLVSTIIALAVIPALMVREVSAAPAPELPLLVIPIGGASPDSPNVQNISVMLREAVKLSDPSVREAAEQARKSITIVFVPGILGSAIADDNGPIWGSRTLPDPGRLRLSNQWIESEEVDPAVTVEVLDNYFGLDQYGNAVRDLQQAAQAIGVGFVACGYDWRRDIRAGARYLHRCLDEHRLLDPNRTLIFVAHSMGGLITWSWHDLFYRSRMSEPVPQVRGIVLVGSPIDGSCEMLRMMREGYAQPSLQARQSTPAIRRALEYFQRERQALVNKLTEVLSHNTIRPVIFTWPGAFELLPGRVEHPDDSCVTEPDLGQGYDTPWYLLDDRFWQVGKPGAWILNMKPPAELPAVLKKADAFREWFRKGDRLVPLVPTFVYRSPVWFTYTRLTVFNNEVLNPPFQETQVGDGRVTDTSASMRLSAPGAIVGDRRAFVPPPFATTYVHGSLLSDPDFQRQCFKWQLPLMVNAHAALAAAAQLTGSPDAVLQEYVSRVGSQATLQWNAVLVALELYPPSDPKHPDHQMLGAQETENARSIVDRFNAALLERGGLARPAYQQARGIQQGLEKDAAAGRVAAAPTFQKAAASLALVAPGGNTSQEQAVFAKANSGLALIQAGDYLTGVAALLDVWTPLNAIPDTFDRKNPDAIRQLKSAVTANLGIALYETGQCEAAKPYLEKSRTNDKAQGRLNQPCRDRESGQSRLLIAPKTP